MFKSVFVFSPHTDYIKLHSCGFISKLTTIYKYLAQLESCEGL